MMRAEKSPPPGVSATLGKNRAHYINTPCMKEALDLAISQFGVDLKLFDCKNRGVVDAVNFLYAGETLYEEWLWPHNYSMNYSHNGMRTDLYTIQSLGRKPVDMKIGTFCHEAGHLICRFPDLYDYGSRDGDSDPSAGMGYFCLMASGSHLNHGRSPAPISGYLRNLAGWGLKRLKELSLPWPTRKGETKASFVPPTILMQFCLP